MKLSSFALAVAACILMLCGSTSAAECKDEEIGQLEVAPNSDKKRGCAWVRREKTVKRCSSPGFTDLCPLTCGACSTAPTTGAEKAENEYQISLIDDSVDVAFNDIRLDSEMLMKLNVTTANVSELSDPIKVFDYDTCKTMEYGSSMLTAMALKENFVPEASSNGLFSAVPVVVDLNTTDITRFNNSALYPGFFSDQDESITLQFCLKPTLGSVVYEGGEAYTISYTKIKVQIILDMTMNFQAADVTIEEDRPSEFTDNVNVDYTLEAYECDAATQIRIDNPPVKTENSIATICIESTSDDIIFGSIKEMSLTQTTSLLTIVSIADTVPSSITDISGTGTKKVVVSTRLISAFFEDLGQEQSTIDIAGVALLEFSSRARRRLVSSDNQVTVRIIKKKEVMLEKKEDLLGEFAVGADISGKNEAAVSSATKTKRFFAALSCALIGVIVYLP